MDTRDTSAKLRNGQHNLLHARLRSRRSAEKPHLGCSCHTQILKSCWRI